MLKPCLNPEKIVLVLYIFEPEITNLTYNCFAFNFTQVYSMMGKY